MPDLELCDSKLKEIFFLFLQFWSERSISFFGEVLVFEMQENDIYINT
jgi:hypothetical protein